MVCLLTPNRYASYTVPVRQYRSLQSRFLHCCRHQQPACDLLMLSRYIGTHKGFAPSGKKIYPRTIGILKKICIFDILTDLRWWVHCSCRAHTHVYAHLATDALVVAFAPAFPFVAQRQESSRKSPTRIVSGVTSKPKKKRQSTT